MRYMNTAYKPKFDGEQLDAVFAWLADPNDKRSAEEVIDDWHAVQKKHDEERAAGQL